MEYPESSFEAQNTELPAQEEGGDVSFEIEQLFGSRTRARLLGLFLEHPDESFFVREVGRKVGAQLHAVRRELKNLLDVGILLEQEAVGEVQHEHKKFYCANTTFPLFEDLRNVLRKMALLMNRSLIQALEGCGEIVLVVLTGRFTGADRIATDVLIVSTCSQEDVARGISCFEENMGREINYTALTPAEYQYRKGVGDRFVQNIFQEKHAIIFGSADV